MIIIMFLMTFSNLFSLHFLTIFLFTSSFIQTYRPHKNGVDDLVLLTDMSNEAINATLSQHFSADEIYVSPPFFLFFFVSISS